MAVTATQYNACKRYRNNGTLDLDNNTINLALLANTYIPNLSLDRVWADISSHEIAAGGNYTTGGKSLAGLLVDDDKFIADDLAFVGLTATFRYGVLRAVGTLNGLVDPLIGYILFDDTPADIVITGETYNVLWNPSGIITF